jgi:hypothetical protein
MSAALRALGVAALLAMAPALAADDLPRSGSEADVRYRHGIPNAIRFDASGAQVWEYNDWRHGHRAFVVSFDAAGQVAASRPLRPEEDVNRAVLERLTRRQTLDRLGEPHNIADGPDGLVWRYRQPSGATLAVRFGADGRITGASTAR